MTLWFHYACTTKLDDFLLSPTENSFVSSHTSSLPWSQDIVKWKRSRMWSWVSQCKIQIQFRLPIIKHNNQTFQIAIANCAFLWSSTFAKASSNDGDEFAGIPQRYADPTYSFPLNQVLPVANICTVMHLFWVAWYHFLKSISPHNTLLSEHCRVKNAHSLQARNVWVKETN